MFTQQPVVCITWTYHWAHYQCYCCTAGFWGEQPLTTHLYTTLCVCIVKVIFINSRYFSMSAQVNDIGRHTFSSLIARTLFTQQFSLLAVAPKLAVVVVNFSFLFMLSARFSLHHNSINPHFFLRIFSFSRRSQSFGIFAEQRTTINRKHRRATYYTPGVGVKWNLPHSIAFPLQQNCTYNNGRARKCQCQKMENLLHIF